MSQERLSYEERNRQREERILQHERALNDSRRHAREIDHSYDGESPEETERIFQRRKKIAIVFGVLAVVFFIHALFKKSSSSYTPPSPVEAVE
ncbi:MAG: hypothetical protein AB1705_16135 [Verrucomicrobiota bacterium]